VSQMKEVMPGTADLAAIFLTQWPGFWP